MAEEIDGFLLTAIEGQVKEGKGVDKCRVKIWDKGKRVKGQVLIYQL